MVTRHRKQRRSNTAKTQQPHKANGMNTKQTIQNEMKSKQNITKLKQKQNNYLCRNHNSRYLEFYGQETAKSVSILSTNGDLECWHIAYYYSLPRQFSSSFDYITKQYITKQYITKQYITEQYITEQYITNNT